MEGAEQGQVVVVGCEVGEAGGVGADGAGCVEEEAAGHGEGYVAEDGGEAFVLGVELV